MAGFSEVTGDEAIMYADNASFDGTRRGGKMTTNGQMWIGATASPHVKLGTITSPSGTLTIGYSSPNITLDVTGGANPIEKINVDVTSGAGTNPVVPNAGVITITGGQYPAGTFGTRVMTIVSDAANQLRVEAQISTARASTLITANGISHYDSAFFSVDVNGFVTAAAPLAFNYTTVNHAASPYTVLSTDYYIAVDTSAGVVSLLFPNAPTTKRQFIVKDKTGTAGTNAITLTTVGGAVNIDGATSQTMTSNYSAVNLLFNAVSYERY